MSNDFTPQVLMSKIFSVDEDISRYKLSHPEKDFSSDNYILNLQKEKLNYSETLKILTHQISRDRNILSTVLDVLKYKIEKIVVPWNRKIDELYGKIYQAKNLQE